MGVLLLTVRSPTLQSASTEAKPIGSGEQRRGETREEGCGGLLGSDMGMGGGVLVPAVACLLLLVGGSVPSTASAAPATVPRREEITMGKGVLYTRSRGRCTPQFWSSRREEWPKMVPQASSLSKVFGSTALERYEPGLTLLEATQRNDDVGGSPFSKLVKQSTAALLNSYTREGFPFTSWEVKTLVIQALVSEEAADAQAKHFKEANEACE